MELTIEELGLLIDWATDAFLSDFWSLQDDELLERLHDERNNRL